LATLGISTDPSRNTRPSNGQPWVISPDGSPVAVCVVPTDENRAIANETAEAIAPPNAA
jgi:acetate kinase